MPQGRTDWLVKVDIHKVYDLRIPDDSTLPSPMFTVLMDLPSDIAGGDKEQSTAYKKDSATCTFNAILMFSANLTPAQFKRSKLTIKCLQYNLISSNLLIGAATFGFDRIYELPRHMLTEEWIPLTNPDKPGKANGYVNISFGIFAPGDEVPATASSLEIGQQVRSISERLVPAPETAFSLCILSLNIHKAEDLQKRESAGFFGSTLRCNPFVKVSFAGVVLKTRIISDTVGPLWNQTMRIPTILPSWDKHVLVEIFSDEKGSESLLGTVDFDFQQLMQSVLPPKWTNLYAPLVTSGKAPASDSLASEYAGRILVSGKVERSAEAVATVIGCDPAPDPMSMEICLWLDVYELSFIDGKGSSGALPDEVWLQLEIGPQIFELPHRATEHGGTYLFGKKGRMQPLTLYFPTAVDSAFDIVISMMGLFRKESRRIVFTRIPLRDILSWKVKPTWFSMLIAGCHLKDPIGANLLLEINAGPSNSKPLERPARADYSIEDYSLRCFLHQATNLPVSDTSSLADPCVRISFAGLAARTAVIPVTLNPVWCEALEIEVSLPTDPALRPDIFIEILDLDIGDNDEAIFEVVSWLTVPLSEVGARWTGPPRWFPLKPAPDYPQQMAHILGAFELVSVKEARSREDFGSFMAPTISRCNVELFLLGVRMNEPIADPIVQVGWGRKDGCLSDPVIRVVAQQSEYGSNGQFNFLQPIRLELDLPEDSVFQEFLEIKVMMEKEAGLMSGIGSAIGSGLGLDAMFSSGSSLRRSSVQGLEMQTIGFGYVHLNQAYDWLSNSERMKWRDFCKIRSPETLRDENAKRIRDQERQDADRRRLMQENLTNNFTIVGKENLDPLQVLELEIEHKYGHRLTSDPTRHNCIALRPTNVFANVPVPTGYEKRTFTDPKLTEFVRNFKWPEDTVLKDARRELEGSLEESFDEQSSDQIAFQTVPLFTGNQWGTFDTVGSLKFCVRVTKARTGQKEKRVSVSSNVDKDWFEPLLKRFTDEYAACSNLLCRLYVFQAEGVIPQGGSLDCDMYLWVRNGPEGANSVSDASNSLSRTAHPEFNRVYSIPTVFPGNTALTISVMEKRALGDQPIGSVTVDVENRWFNAQYQRLLKGGGFERSDIPNEVLLLKDEEAFITKGRLKVRLEVMSTQASMSRAVEAMPSALPENYQVRMVIWSTKQVACLEGDDSTHQTVSLIHQKADDIILEESTDTHYGSLDGTGIFNWRLVMDTPFPCPDPTFRVRLNHQSVIGMKYSIGEAVLNLGPDLQRARKLKKFVEMPRSWIPISHPAFPGQVRGLIEMQIKVLTPEEALTYKVGKGREEPNTDPVVDGTDPILVDHRRMLANTEFGRKAAEIASSVMKGVRITFWIFVACAVIGGIIFLLIVLRQAGLIGNR